MAEVVQALLEQVKKDAVLLQSKQAGLEPQADQQPVVTAKKTQPPAQDANR